VKFPFLSKIVLRRNESENNGRQCMCKYIILYDRDIHNQNERTDDRTDSSSPAAGAMIAAEELIENFREDYYNNNGNNNNIWYRFLFTFEHG